MSDLIAVAGGHGFLGSAIVSQSRSMGYQVVPFSRRTGMDIRELESVTKYLKEIRPDVLVNSAAHVGGISYNAIKPVEIYEDNLLIGFNLLKASFETGVKKFVNIMPNCTYPGNAEIYSESEWWDGPMHDTVLTYGMPRKSLWVHAWAMKRKHGFNSIHLVLPNLYGPNDHFDPVRSHALGAIVKKVVDAHRDGRETVEVWGTGTPIREWGYVYDAAEGIVRGIEKYNDIEIMNIGQGKGYSIREMALAIKQAVHWSGKFIFDTSKPDGAPKKILDVTKMKSILNWEPPTDLITGIQKTIEWYSRNS